VQKFLSYGEKSTLMRYFDRSKIGIFRGTRAFKYVLVKRYVFVVEMFARLRWFFLINIYPDKSPAYEISKRISKKRMLGAFFMATTVGIFGSEVG
jgi:hypothetical protein